MMNQETLAVVKWLKRNMGLYNRLQILSGLCDVPFPKILKQWVYSSMPIKGGIYEDLLKLSMESIDWKEVADIVQKEEENVSRNSS